MQLLLGILSFLLVIIPVVIYEKLLISTKKAHRIVAVVYYVLTEISCIYVCLAISAKVGLQKSNE